MKFFEGVISGKWNLSIIDTTTDGHNETQRTEGEN